MRSKKATKSWTYGAQICPLTETKIYFSFICLWKCLRMIHKMFIPPCSTDQKIFHGTLTFCTLHHIKLSSASAFGTSFTFECTETLPSTVSCAWRWMCIKIYCTVFVLSTITSDMMWTKFYSWTRTHLPRLRLTTVAQEVFFRLCISTSHIHIHYHHKHMSGVR